MAKPRILLVEDNAQNRVLATFLLEDAGFEVITALNGAEGLEKARTSNPDLILLDIQLPDIDGYELLGRLKKQPEIANVPIVAVTSYAMAGERNRALDLGCVGYIEKPIDTANFAKDIAAYLSGRKAPLKILIVEDRADSAVLLQDNLEHEGYEVVHAVNGREALEKIAHKNFDLVITDLLMPEMDGYQLTYALKRDERFKHIPILIYTATYTDPKDRELALGLGAADFIVKPAQNDLFMNRIGDLLKKAHRGIPATPVPLPEEAPYLKQYAERLVHKLEDKVQEADAANRKLEQANAALEKRVAEATGELRQTIEQLNAANKELESFAYTVAHDLRAPLRTVRGLVTILRETHGGSLSADAQMLCQRLEHNAGLMDRLIEDLLAYSRLGASNFVLAPVPLDKAVERAMNLLGGVIQESGAQVEVSPSLPAVVGHEPTLVQVLENLLANAIKFVAPGVKPKVSVAGEANGQHVRVTVCDNGIGIAREFQQRIFQVFERLHDSDTYPGTGVGLAVVKKGIEKMGGTLGMESEPGRGSCFWIELPKAV